MPGTKTLALFAALGLPVAAARSDDPPVAGKKPAVAISGDSLTINGKSLTLPCTRKELIGALGNPDRESKLANPTLTWDDLGVFACVKPNTTTVTAVSIALDRDTPSFWPKKNFAGTLTVDGAPVTADATLAAINDAKKGKPFEKDATDADAVTIDRKVTANYLRKGNAGRFVELTVEAKDE
jgi:hypothetical protein